MAFILRVDVDKPFGHHNLPSRILSKFSEDYFSFPVKLPGYLKHIKSLLQYLNSNRINAVVYFRRCTVPDEEVIDLMISGGHILGFHAEDTRSFDTFQKEFQAFQGRFQNKIITFNKHGNGTYKLGRNHFPPFEPDKYKTWANILGINYIFGNGIANSLSELSPDEGYYENMFWIEESYRSPYLNDIRLLAGYAEDHTIPLIVHPENYYTYIKVQDDLNFLVDYSRQSKIEWTNPFN